MIHHEVAEIFPMMSGDSYEQLKADIAAHGVREPAWVLDGKILDGRNRAKACEELGVDLPCRVYEGNDPCGFVISLNLHRRHLDESQRGLIAARLATLPQGARTDLSPFGEKSQAEAAELLNVGKRTVERAREVLDCGDEELIAAIDAGKKTVTEAVRELKERGKEERREENRQLVAATPALATMSARFATIVIDPPWDWGDEGDVSQLGRARPTYSTVPYEELLTLPVADRADDDCHIYLWITNRSLPKGFALLDQWGFRYVTCLTWVKPSFGMGNYFRGQTEQVLFGVKGSQALKRKDVGTVFHAPRGPQHSSKPAEFFDLVESCSPGPYLQIYARGSRVDWTYWGAEADAA